MINSTKLTSGDYETLKIKNNIDKVTQIKNEQKYNTIEDDLEKENTEKTDNSLKTIKVSELLFKTIKNTSSIFVLSSTTTILNFLCNIPLLRAVSKESFGTVKVYFELAFSLINYIPRETIRRTSQKFCPDKDQIKEKQKYILTSQLNIIILIAFSFIGIIIFFCFLFFTHSPQLHNNLIQLIIYMICALIELLCEPVILYMNLKVENKFIPITISSLSRIISNTIFAVFFNLDLWSFTLSRIIGSLVYLLYILYLGYFKYKINFREFIPKDICLLIKGKMKDDINIKYLRTILFQFMRLNLLNLIIQNCEGLVLSFVIKNLEEEKSDYSFVSQNFSLLLRFFVEPVIDGFYILVNKLKYMEKKKENKNLPEEINKDIYQHKNNNLDKSETEIKEEYSSNNMQPTERKFSGDLIGENKEQRDYSKKEKKEKNKIKEQNIFLALKVLQLFMKIFFFFGIILIGYYNLFGINIIELIYGKKWANYNIDKIGDSYTYYVAILSISNIIESFANATNDSRQMNLSYISLIANSSLLICFMYLFSKWDICGIIMANVLSSLFIINSLFLIVFCGKKEKKQNEITASTTLIEEIKNFQKNCFLTTKSLISSGILIAIGFFIKKIILANSSLIVICLICGLITIINCIIICFYEYKQFKINLDEIKSYN